MLEVKFLSVSRRTGISAKTGNPYDMCLLAYLVPMQDKKTESYTYIAHGHEVKELELAPNILDDFRVCSVGDLIRVNLAPNPANPVKNLVSELTAVNGKAPVVDKKVKALAP